MLRRIIYIVEHKFITRFFNLMFEFTVTAMLEDMLSQPAWRRHTFTLLYLETLYANNSVEKCSFTSKIIPVLMF